VGRIDIIFITLLAGRRSSSIIEAHATAKHRRFFFDLSQVRGGNGVVGLVDCGLTKGRTGRATSKKK
jgi:hypothetical protein